MAIVPVVKHADPRSEHKYEHYALKYDPRADQDCGGVIVLLGARGD